MSREAVVNVYDGPTKPKFTARSLAECERLWNEGTVKPGTFDELLSAQLERAVSQGRKSVTVLDLGSGAGALIKNVLNDNGFSSHSRTQNSRALLSENPDLKVHMVGLTDAKNSEDFFKSEPITASNSFTVPHPTNKQIAAENIHYSITADQTLEAFLDQAGIQQVDLIFATAFFLHLPDGVYEQTLFDAVAALRKHGKMVVRGYHTATKKFFERIEEKKKALADSDAQGMMKLVDELVAFMAAGEKADVQDPRLYEKQDIFGILKIGQGVDVAFDRKVVSIQKHL